MPSPPPYTYRLDAYNPLANEWTYGPQPVVHPLSEQLHGWAKFGIGVGTLAVLGEQQFAGKRGWDYLINAVRAVEEYSPGRVFRTFQVSHMLSVLEASSLQARYFSPELLTNLRKTEIGREWLDHITRVAGRSITSAEVMAEGFRYEGGRLLLGREGGQVLLRRAGVVRAPTGAGPRFQEAYARSLAGGPLPRQADVFTQPISYLDTSGKIQKEAFMFTGGRSRLQAAGRYLAGYGTALAERINQLARAPFELPVISGLMRRIPLVRNLQFSVTPSSGLRTIGKITAKLGILGSATYLAYQEFDYLARKSKTLDDTIFSEGLTAGFATLWTRSQVAASKAAESLGLHDYREWQESVAPGSTELSRLIAFPLLGALGGLGVGYAGRLLTQTSYQRAGFSLTQASRAVEAGGAFFRSAIYGTKVPEEILQGLDKTTVSLIEKQTEHRLAGWSGNLARKIAAVQSKRTFTADFLNLFGRMTPGRMRWMIGGAIGAAVALPFLPGALIPSDRPEELEALYSGKEDVAIRKGRWWEFGRSAYEGQRIDRYRQHWYPRMLARAKEKAIWGEDAPSPMERWWIENFTYDLERKFYEERPYPVTGTAFEDIPFIGPILSATLGRIIKPPVLMHQEEWLGSDGTTRRPPLKYGETVIPGELEPGSPIDPYGAKGIVGEQAYRMTEMIGLPGFTMTAIKEAITGTPDVFDQEMQLESARRMYGAERDYWDLELGGGLGTTELLRRLYPHRRRQIELYNPIRNKMPEWLPGPGERSPDFLHGDPFTKVAEGEMRLPGPGYAALHPELKGIAPEDYPAFHRFAILADVAPYSDKYKESLIDVRTAMGYKRLSQEEIARYKTIIGQVASRKVKKEFSPYLWSERARTPIEEMLAKANEQEKGPREDSWYDRTVGTYWETLTRNAETPLEFLTPVSPASKLIHMRTAVEDYERTQVYGTDNAFWGHPIRDFFGPFFDASKHALGWEGIPEHVQERRDLEEYFDILKYTKYTRLKNAAQAAHDTATVDEYESKRRETLFGINPFTFNFSHIYRALPRRERDYFNAFAEADMNERAEIVKMVPENEQALLTARWKLKDAADLQQAIKKGLLSEEQAQAGEAVLSDFFRERQAEGMPQSEILWAEYIATRMPGESYADWYRRTKLLEEKLEGKSLPGPDWVGWHPAVELEDIKAKIVLDEGKNAYDYDIWPDRLRGLARRPIIDEAATELEEAAAGIDPNEVRTRIMEVLAAHNIYGPHIALVSGGRDNVIDLQLEEDRGESSVEQIRKILA